METHQLTQKFTELWLAADEQKVLLFPVFNGKEKQNREKYVANFLKDARNLQPELLSLYNDPGKSGETILTQLKALFIHAFSYRPRQVELMFSDEMLACTRQFVRQVRDFDPSLPAQSIFQACRNVWIMNSLQLILGVKVELTPSIFAYSMLYPYTDNFVDDPHISNAEKVAFSQRFAQLLAGENMSAFNEQEEKIYHMISLIGDQYDRQLFPEVFQSLLMIHQAQTASMGLLGSKSRSPMDSLKICIAKGGSSVLADGYLVAGNLSGEQCDFLFGFGAYLQLLDDIQDVKEDLADGLMTAFSLAAIDQKLDSAVLKTFNFGEAILEHSRDLLEHMPLDFKGLLQQSMLLFLLESVATDHQYYSEEFQAEMEKLSPLSFGFIQGKRNFFTPQKKHAARKAGICHFETTARKSCIGRGIVFSLSLL